MKFLNLLSIGMMFLVLFGCVGEPTAPIDVVKSNETVKENKTLEENKTEEEKKTEEPPKNETPGTNQTDVTVPDNETTETEQPAPFCGDGKINQANESCEKGVKCKDPNAVCDEQTCKCMVKATPVPTCYQNTGQTAANQSTWESGMVCKDDCPSGMYCDASACVCMQKTTVSCSGVKKTITPVITNLTIVAKTNATTTSTPVNLMPIPSGGSQYSIDSFFDVFTELTVDSNRSTLNVSKKVATPDSFFDVFTKINISTDKGFDPDTMVCKDDCSLLGLDYVCDSSTCNCQYKPKKTFSCYSNTKSQVYNSTSKKFIIVFVQTLNVCSDDCSQAAQEYGGTWTCNLKTCTCEQTPVQCASNTKVTTNKYSWQYGKCEDNCNTLGKEYSCDPFSCTCKKTTEMTSECGNGVVDKDEACEYDYQCSMGMVCASCQCMTPVQIVQ